MQNRLRPRMLIAALSVMPHRMARSEPRAARVPTITMSLLCQARLGTSAIEAGMPNRFQRLHLCDGLGLTEQSLPSLDAATATALRCHTTSDITTRPPYYAKEAIEYGTASLAGLPSFASI